MATTQGEKHLHSETETEKEEGIEVVHHDDENPPRGLPGTKTFLKEPPSEAPKQWIVLRKDLKMRKGKMVAQGSHGVLAVILEQMVKGPEEGKFTLWASDALLAWIEGKFTKICVGARSEEELLEVYAKAKGAGIMCTLITDAGLTEFNGVPTNTCVVIGPAYPSQVNPITGDLPLL
jgi:PTH2 family peptidyl-tRNA hydrolase